MSKAVELLREAAIIVDGPRNSTHGEKERSFTLIANFWNAYCEGRKVPEAPISPLDVAQMMALMKIARSIQGEPVTDHFVDCAGYMAIAGELAEAGK